MGVVIKQSLGRRARKIALKRALPFVTVETIIKDLLADWVESAKKGERIVIDGLTSITIVKDLDSGEYLARGRVSPALKSHLNEVDVPKVIEN